MPTQDKINPYANQHAEFEAVQALNNIWGSQPAIVDDDYPEWRFNYERALFALIKAVRVNHDEQAFNMRSR